MQYAPRRQLIAPLLANKQHAPAPRPFSLPIALPCRFLDYSLYKYLCVSLYALSTQLILQ